MGCALIAFTPPNYALQDFRWTAVIWDVETATERRRLSLPDTAFAIPGQPVDTSTERLAVGFADGSVSLYDLRTGKEEKLPERHKPANPKNSDPWQGVVAVRMTQAGNTLVTAGGDNLIRVWNVASGKKSQEFTWSNSRIEAMDVSPDGTVLALGGRDGVVHLLNTSTGALTSPQPGHQRGVLSVAVSKDGRIAATTGMDRTIRIWDLEKARESHVITCDGFLSDCALAPDQKSLLAGVYREEDDDPDRATLHLWNVTNGKEVRATGLTGVRAESVRFALDGRTLVTLSGDTMTIRNWPRGERLHEIRLPQRKERGFRTLGSILGMSPDTELLVTMVRHVNWWRGQVIDAVGGSLDLWGTKSGKHLERLAESDGMTERAAFTVAGELVITNDSPPSDLEDPPPVPRGVFHVLDAGTRRLKRKVPVPMLVTALAVSRDGRTPTSAARRGQFTSARSQPEAYDIALRATTIG